MGKFSKTLTPKLRLMLVRSGSWLVLASCLAAVLFLFNISVIPKSSASATGTATDEATLRSALGTGGIVSLNPPGGVITVTAPITVSVNNTTITTSGGTVEVRAVNATGVFYISPGISTTINNVKVSGGHNTGLAESGAGILVDSNGTLNLTNSLITGNSTAGGLAKGAGIAVRSGTLNMTNDTVSNNTAGSDGGGIVVETLLGGTAGRATLVNSTISGNTGLNGGGISVVNASVDLTNTAVLSNTTLVSSTIGGGGIFVTGNSASLRIDATTVISANSSHLNGGGIALFSGQFAATGSSNSKSGTISNNSANDNGGGIYVDSVGGTLTKTISLTDVTMANNVADKDNNSSGDGGAISLSGATLSIVSSTIGPGNSAENGGGLYNTADSSNITGTVNLTNTTVAANVAVANGGGINNNLGAINLSNVTVFTNTAAIGGGVLNGSGAVLNIKNTIVGANAAAAGPDGHTLTAAVSQDYNLIGNTSGFNLTGTTSNNKVNIDHRLAQLANNGGNTLTAALLAGSPAIDAGNPSTFAATDQRGITRPQGARSDIGAFERGTTNSLTATAGTPQMAPVNTTYGTSLQAVVRDSMGGPLDGVSVTFTAPSSGASGTFAGGSNSVVVTTDTSGTATATAFTANDIAGSFIVAASAGGVSANYDLTNTLFKIYLPVILHSSP